MSTSSSSVSTPRSTQPALHSGPCNDNGLTAGCAYASSLVNFIRAFELMSIDSPSATRAIITIPSWMRHPQGSVPLQYRIGDSRAVGIVQNTKDVCFNFVVPARPEGDTASGSRSPRVWVAFRIYYDPGSQSCVLHNQTDSRFSIHNLSGNMDGNSKLEVDPRGLRILKPGLWIVFDESSQHILSMLILQRHFAVSVGAATVQASANTIYNGLTDCGASSEIPSGPHRLSADASNDQTEFLLFRQVPCQSRALVARDEEGESALSTLNIGEIAYVHSVVKNVSDAPTLSYSLTPIRTLNDSESGSIFTAEHSKHAGQVVAKIIKYESSEYAGAGDRENAYCLGLQDGAHMWLREVEALRHLHHGNIVRLLDYDARLFAITLEKLPGSLSRCGLQSTWTLSDANIILGDMVSALSYLKAQLVLHNDINPRNICYSPERGAVLIDFGFATTDNDPIADGTAWYIPEECLGPVSRDHLSDVWALGVTMLYVLQKINLPEGERSSCCHILQIQQDEERLGEQREWYREVWNVREELGTSDPIGRSVRGMLNVHDQRVCEFEGSNS